MYPQDIDPREFGPEPDEDVCVECGAGADEDCVAGCPCDACIARRDADYDEEYG